MRFEPLSLIHKVCLLVTVSLLVTGSLKPSQSQFYETGTSLKSISVTVKMLNLRKCNQAEEFFLCLGPGYILLLIILQAQKIIF